MTRLIIGSGTLGRAWPVSPQSPACVLVARTHYAGLRSLQDAVTDWAGHGIPSVALVGVALIRDTPERKLPPALRDLADVVTAGATQLNALLWELPWVEDWRRGQEPSLTGAPKEYRQMAVDLEGAVPALRGGMFTPTMNRSYP